MNTFVVSKEKMLAQFAKSSIKKIISLFYSLNLKRKSNKMLSLKFVKEFVIRVYSKIIFPKFDSL
jgi:hypothetical protein